MRLSVHASEGGNLTARRFQSGIRTPNDSPQSQQSASGSYRTAVATRSWAGRWTQDRIDGARILLAVNRAVLLSLTTGEARHHHRFVSVATENRRPEGMKMEGENLRPKMTVREAYGSKVFVEGHVYVHRPFRTAPKRTTSSSRQ